jgi:hypothetical protein
MDYSENHHDLLIKKEKISFRNILMKIMYQHHHFCMFSIHWVLITVALPKSSWVLPGSTGALPWSTGALLASSRNDQVAPA